MHITQRHRILTTHALTNSESKISVNAISTKGINYQIFAITLKPSDMCLDPNMQYDIKALLNDYQDCLSRYDTQRVVTEAKREF